MPDSVPDPADLLDREGAANYLRSSVTTVDRRTRDGSLPHYRLSGRVLYDPADLRALVASARVDAAKR